VKINSASIQNWILPVAAVVAWEIFGRAGMLPRYLSFPSAILAALWELAVTGELLVALAASLYRVSTGFVLGTVAGVVVGLGAGIVPGIRHFFDPLVSFLYSIPKIAFLPVFLLLFGLGHASKIAIIAFSGFFPVFVASRHAVLSVNKLLIWTAQNMGTPERKIFSVVIPAAALQLFSRHPHRPRPRVRGAVCGGVGAPGAAARHHHLIRRGVGAVRPDVRRHRVLCRARFRERPHPACGSRPRPQGG
jgi:ABC-type nitrate/sulfonate/bicarbonate transport system permease component